MIPLLLAAATLFEQSAIRAIEVKFAAQSYIIYDAREERIVAAHWVGLERPVSQGSLTKPFVASAARFPSEFACDARTCWQPVSHGRLNLAEAIAQSCNSYFLQLAASIPFEDLSSFAANYDLPPPPAEQRSWIGLDGGWPISPERMIKAYANLLRTSSSVQGALRRAVLDGTARALAADALAKTGTAPCVHPKKAPGDGYVVALEGRYVLLVRVHGVSGAVAAATAGQILRVLRDGS